MLRLGGVLLARCHLAPFNAQKRSCAQTFDCNLTLSVTLLLLLVQYERMESIPEVGVAVEHGEGEREDKVRPQPTWGESSDHGTLLPSPERFQYQKQVEYHSSLTFLSDVNLDNN